jgi:phage baseplate assembly protein W
MSAYAITPPNPAAGSAPAPAPEPPDPTRFDLRFPLAVGRLGRVEGATYGAHVRQMIEQLLFTSPGERVNRPDFGCGVRQLVFGPAGPAQAAATQFLVTGALQRWLGDVIQVEAVTVEGQDSTLAITIQYVLRATAGRRTDTFALGAAT